MCMINVVTCNEVNISPPFKNCTTHLSLRTSYPPPHAQSPALQLVAGDTFLAESYRFRTERQQAQVARGYK